MNTDQARIILDDLFDYLEKEGGGRIRCLKWLGVIEMLIKGKWTPLMPTIAADIYAIAAFKKIRIAHECIKLYSHIDGRKFVFHKIPSTGFHSISLLGDVITHNFIGVFNNNAYHLLANVKFISSLCAGTHHYYDEDMNTVFTLIGVVSYTSKLGYFTIIKNILCVHSKSGGTFAMFSECDNLEARSNLPDALIINEKIYRFCHHEKQLRSDDGDIKHCMRHTLTNYSAIWETSRFTLKGDLRYVVAVCGIYIAYNLAGTHFEQVYERALAGSGKHTKAAIRAD
jgi:hypothetical protein